MEWLIRLFQGTSTPDLLGHLFYISILTGTILLTKKKKFGWLARCLGDVGWVTIGYMIGMYSIMIWSSVFFLNDLRGYLVWKWSEDENKQCEIEGERVAKIRGKSHPVRIRVTGYGRGKPSNGLPRHGYSPGCLCFECLTAKLGVQEHKDVPKPKRPRTVKGKQKARDNTSGGVEAAPKGNVRRNRVPKSKRLSTTNKGTKK